MNDLGLDISQIVSYFTHEQSTPYVLIHISEEHVANWEDTLNIPLRRCYVDDTSLAERSVLTGRSQADILAAKLPDRGAVMAGDFGEILVFLYHAAHKHPTALIGPKKWRLKQDRTKAAPFSDVVHFILPSWPQASEQDCVLCSEVKTKSTASSFSPIVNAVSDCAKDRKSRLAKTLVWLRERALNENLGTISIEHLERFINATDNPEYQKHFRAVAVVCSSLIDEVLTEAPTELSSDYTVVVISVPNLKQVYEAMFDAAQATVAEVEVVS